IFCRNMDMKRIGIIMMMLAITGCYGQNFYKPVPFRMGRPDPNVEAPEGYMDGWNDGCETGLSTMVQSFYKSFYKYKINMKMIDHPVYYKAWKDAYTYCRHYSFRYTWEPFDKGFGKAFDNKLCVICSNNTR